MADDNYITLYDSTLRDGSQMRGVDFTIADKLAIARALDEFGIDYVEGGWPGANPKDDAFFENPPAVQNTRITAFGMTRRPGRSASNDPGLSALLDQSCDHICLVGKSWDFHIEEALGITADENEQMIADSIAECVKRGKEASFDAEHFFDGYKANPNVALRMIHAAHDAGFSFVDIMKELGMNDRNTK